MVVLKRWIESYSLWGGWNRLITKSSLYQVNNYFIFSYFIYNNVNFSSTVMINGLDPNKNDCLSQIFFYIGIGDG